MEKTAQDVERLQQALKRERADRKHHQIRAEGLDKFIMKMGPRIEALEAQSQAASVSAVVDALAGIRRDLQAQLAGLQAEIDDLHQQLQEVMRRP